MNTSTRIRQYLEVNGSATVYQLCRVLDLTKADIHYHMRLLLKQEVIGILPEPYQDGAGRPARQFFLVKPAPESLSRLIITLLTDSHRVIDDEAIKKQGLAEYLADGILRKCVIPVDQSFSPAIRLTKIIKLLSTYGIHLRWLARKDGPLIYFEQEYLSSLIRDPVLVKMIMERLLLKIQKKVA